MPTCNVTVTYFVRKMLMLTNETSREKLKKAKMVDWKQIALIAGHEAEIN